MNISRESMDSQIALITNLPETAVSFQLLISTVLLRDICLIASSIVSEKDSGFEG